MHVLHCACWTLLSPCTHVTLHAANNSQDCRYSCQAPPDGEAQDLPEIRYYQFHPYLALDLQLQAQLRVCTVTSSVTNTNVFWVLYLLCN